MNKHQFKGRFKQLSGSVKEIVGRLVRDKPLEDRGRVQKIAARIQGGYGNLKHDLQKDR